MSEPLDDLTAILEAQAVELRALLPLLDEQQAALSRADSAAVAAVLVRQEPILRRFHRLDQRRQAAALTLAACLGVHVSQLSLSMLLARIPGAPLTLAALRTELRELLRAVDVRNRRNAFLVDRAVACIEGLVRAVMAPVAEPSPVYAATGQPARRGSGPRVLDRSA